MCGANFLNTCDLTTRFPVETINLILNLTLIRGAWTGGEQYYTHLCMVHWPLTRVLHGVLEFQGNDRKGGRGRARTGEPEE